MASDDFLALETREDMLLNMEIIRPKSAQPIPPHAKIAFKGKLFDVYQWEQEQFDGTTATYEKVKRPDTVIVFPVLPDGKILLTKQEQPGTVPFIAGAGGRIDEGEEVLEAAKRELLEETGYEADEWMLWHSQQPVTKIDWAVYIFIAKGLKKVGDLSLDAGEKIELYPVTFEEFLLVGTETRFAEREIVPRILEARFDPNKKEELRKMFS